MIGKNIEIKPNKVILLNSNTEFNVENYLSEYINIGEFVNKISEKDSLLSIAVGCGPSNVKPNTNVYQQATIIFYFETKINDESYHISISILMNNNERKWSQANETKDKYENIN